MYTKSISRIETFKGQRTPSKLSTFLFLLKFFNFVIHIDKND